MKLVIQTDQHKICVVLSKTDANIGSCINCSREQGSALVVRLKVVVFVI